MAHVQKFTGGAVGGLSSHIERKTYNHSNKEIDNERSVDNYDLCEKDGDMNARYKERMDDVYCLNRSDVKVMADWVVTLPEELKEAHEGAQKRFFEESYDFLSERYGKENVLAGAVHNDETTPHMHFAFMPVTFDEKKQREKVSAKEVLTRNDLKTFHEDLDKHLKERIPEIYQEGVLNNKTLGIEDVPTLKEKSEEINRLEQELDEKRTEVSALQKDLDQKKKSISSEVKRAKEIQSGLSDVFDTQDKFNEFDRNMKRTMTGKRIVSAKEFNELKQFVTGVEKSAVKSTSKAHKLDGKNESLHESLDAVTKERDKAVNRRDELISERNDLESQNRRLRTELRVSDSKLRDFGYDRSKMPQIERQGHLVMSNLERGLKPNKKQASEWKEILEENKERKLLNSDRLKERMEQLKAIMEKVMNAFRGISL